MTRSEKALFRALELELASNGSTPHAYEYAGCVLALRDAISKATGVAYAGPEIDFAKLPGLR